MSPLAQNQLATDDILYEQYEIGFVGVEDIRVISKWYKIQAE